MPKSFSRLKHEESKPNSELQVISQKENKVENIRNWASVGILQGCENFATCRISQVAKFRNLLPGGLFDPILTTFCNFFPNYPLCIIGSSYIFVISLVLSSI